MRGDKRRRARNMRYTRKEGRGWSDRMRRAHDRRKGLEAVAAERRERSRDRRTEQRRTKGEHFVSKPSDTFALNSADGRQEAHAIDGATRGLPHAPP